MNLTTSGIGIQTDIQPREIFTELENNLGQFCCQNWIDQVINSILVFDVSSTDSLT